MIRRSTALYGILSFALANPAYAALNCTTQPTCESLGYSKQDYADCAQDGYVFCPYDITYKKCVMQNVDKEVTEDGVCAGFDLTSCPYNASCYMCESESGTKYAINEYLNTCMAYNYDELLSYIGDNSCQVVALANNISGNVDDENNFVFAENQILDGRGYSLSLYDQYLKMTNGSKINDLTLSGTPSSNMGMINISGDNVVVSDINISKAGGYYAIVTKGSGVDFVMKGTNKIEASLFGMMIGENDNFTLEASANLDIVMKDYSGTDFLKPTALYIQNNAYIDGNLNISGSDLNYTSSGQGIYMDGTGDDGLVINGKTNINFSNSDKMSAIWVSNNNITVNGSLDITANGKGHGIYSEHDMYVNGDVKINYTNTASGFYPLTFVSTHLNGTLEIQGLSSNNKFYIGATDTDTKLEFLSDKAKFITTASSYSFTETDAGVNVKTSGVEGAIWELNSVDYNRKWKCIENYAVTSESSAVPPSTYWCDILSGGCESGITSCEDIDGSYFEMPEGKWCETYQSYTKSDGTTINCYEDCVDAYESCSAYGEDYYDVEDTEGMYCENAVEIYLADGSKTLCYTDCEEAYESCSAYGEDYYDVEDTEGMYCGNKVTIRSTDGTSVSCYTDCVETYESCSAYGEDYYDDGDTKLQDMYCENGVEIYLTDGSKRYCWTDCEVAYESCQDYGQYYWSAEDTQGMCCSGEVKIRLTDGGYATCLESCADDADFYHATCEDALIFYGDEDAVCSEETTIYYKDKTTCEEITCPKSCECPEETYELSGRCIRLPEYVCNWMYKCSYDDGDPWDENGDYDPGSISGYSSCMINKISSCYDVCDQKFADDAEGREDCGTFCQDTVTAYYFNKENYVRLCQQYN